MTEQLYYKDPRLSQFEAGVLHQEKEDERWAVILDRTAFYPEGGGQPADRGRLNGVEVLDVQKRGEEIRHYLAQRLAENDPVSGSIDWPRRLEYMQQHTGQHIVSASLIRAAGYPTISAYLGERYTAVEIDTERIEEGEIEAAEALANDTVRRNLPVRVHWIDPEEAERFQLRKPPPDVEKLRIVQIEGVDAAACAGIHVDSTGQVGLIKYDGLEKIRGRLRLHWLIGQRAYADTRREHGLIAQLNRELTCGTEQILSSVRELKNSIRQREQRIAELEKILAQQRMHSLVEAAESRAGIRLVQETFVAEERSLIQGIYQGLLEQEKVVACLLNRNAEQVHWWIGCSAELEIDWSELLPPLYPLIQGKGGGRDRSWQGIGSNAAGTGRFLEALRQAILDSVSGGGNA
jgi:alanyl-tRNA synthetase